ncbi:MAG TPA: hypothetical protein PKZ32_09255, partial [Candidatus Melainabacteria bacterium]|nr:hypothetical protein [Candidatus Melainabacteria bacterium]
MTLRNLGKRFVAILAFAVVLLTSVNLPSFASGREVEVPDFQFQPIRPTQAVTIREAVDVSLRNYPQITSKLFKLRAAKANVALAKTQYLPNLNIDTQ